MEDKKNQILLTRSVSELEKNLHKTSSLFNELKTLTESLQSIEDQTNTLEQLTEKDPELNALVKTELSNKNIIEKFKSLENNLHALKTTIKGFEEPKFKTDLFLENYKTESIFSFDTDEDFEEFLSAVTKDYSDNNLFFGPSMLGIVNLSLMAEQLELEKISPHYEKLQRRQLPKLLNHLKKQPVRTEFIFDSKNLRISFTNFRKLKIKTDSETIRKIERLGKLYNAFQ
ncbi:MAG: hypothetical protein Q7K42_02430 [Candidatus Diapherotrites archaeon]|nr:hypothetical protein [Candidatus Diapherotrites archaeon]